MKHHLVAATCIGLLATAGWSYPAAAQFEQYFNNSQQQEDVPPQQPPPLPQEAYDARIESQIVQPNTHNLPPGRSYYQRFYEQRNSFPPLPPSRTCLGRDLDGLWRLEAVYEEPPGNELVGFKAHRYQYLLFEKSNVYGKFKSNINLPASDVEKEINRQNRALRQYVLDENGIIYFYNQGVAVDSQACFIVANARGAYQEGQMLLMPPKGQHPGRLAKVFAPYEKEPKTPRRRGRRR